MEAPAAKSRVIRFGVFELDLQEAELRKSGLRIKLQEQPFQILTMLLEHPGQTVTREEMRRQLWSEETFVDFDHSLNSSIKKLREALGDDSDNPRFIETLHRRGYRFIAPTGVSHVHVVAPNEPILPASVVRGGPGKLANWRKGATVAALAAGVAGLVLWLRLPLQAPRIVRTQELTNDGFLKGTLVTDGNRIYFTELPPGRVTIAQVSTAGGETVSADIPVPNPAVKSLSRKTSELLVLGLDGAYWSIPLPAGSPRRIDEVSGHSAAWTPDGKLLFAKAEVGASIREPGDKDDLYIAEHDGSKPRKFAAAPGSAEDFSFSPDGNRFRFTLTNPTNWASAIWEARMDGSDMHALFPGSNAPTSDCCGHWTPDGKYYIFQSTRERTTSIWAVRESFPWWKRGAHEPVQLTVGPLQLSRPLPSTDGKTLFAIGTHQRAELVRYDSKSGEFVPYLGGISAGDVDFTRDGNWVTYVSFPDHTLWRSKLDGSDRRQLTYSPMFATLAHWSPDGQRIAFSGHMPGKPWKVFLIPKDGGAPQAITSDELEELDPTWSADGKTLAFGRSALMNDDSSRIALFDLESQQISELPNSQRLCCPRWSPDGRYIVAATTGHQDHLMLYDFNNKQWRKLNTPDMQPLSFGYLTWSRNSSYIYFDTNVVDGYFRLRISDSRLDRPLNLKKLRRYPDPFGWESWTGLGPGDTPLFVRDISTQEIYALDLELP